MKKETAILNVCAGLGVALLVAGCATSPQPLRAGQEAAARACEAAARAELKSIGNEDIDVYVATAVRKGGRIVVDIFPPPFKDPYKDIPYFGGGGSFVCTAAGVIVSRQYER